MVKITVTYAGNLHCSATHGPSGRVVETDAPVDNQGRGESFSPTDLVATALASCMATIMGIYAQRNEIDLAGMRIEIGKEMTPTAPRRIARLPVEVWLPTPLTKDPALENAALTCPVFLSLHPDIEKTVTFHWGQ